MFAVGDVITDERSDRYEVTAELGQGGQGFVFRARRERDGREFVLKHMPFEPDVAACEKRTRKLVDADLSCVLSPALAGPVAIVPAQIGVAYVMPTIAGEELEKLLGVTHWSPPERLEIAAAIAAVLARVRDGDALHGDVSARNFLLERTAAGIWHVGVIDLDNLVHRRLPDAPMVGTPEYMPPEVLSAVLAKQPVVLSSGAENFALGVVLHEVLRGVHPFVRHDGEPPSQLLARLAMGPTEWMNARGDVAVDVFSGDLRRLFSRAFSTRPSDRPDPDEWWRVLRRDLCEIYVCDCGAACVADTSRTTCPACGGTPGPWTLATNMGHRIVLDCPDMTIGAGELAWPAAEPKHLRVRRVGFGYDVQDPTASGVFLVGARAVKRIPPGEWIELRMGDQLRVAGLDVRVET